MRMTCGRLSTILAVAMLIAAPAEATTIKVLWTAGTSAYNDNITELATEAATFDPDGNGALNWSLTIWDHGITPAPDFSAYDVLVVGSTYGVDQNIGGSNGFFNIGVSARGVLENKAAIEAARGSRTFLTGQDPDLHDLISPRNQDDGPKGFMINAVNWAASGSGLGIVSLVSGWGEAFGLHKPGWWDHADSFLRDELLGSFAFIDSDLVEIGSGMEDFAVNEGLTSAGLSNWVTSSHALFDVPVPGYTAINFAPGGKAITIVTAGREDGDTDGGDEATIAPIPLPAGAWLLLSALAAVGVAGRRRRAV